MNSYPIVSLGDLVEVMHQGINTAADKVQYATVGVPIIQSKHFTGGVLTLENTKFLNEIDTQKYKGKYIPKRNDLLFSNIGTVGKSIIVNCDTEFMFAWNVFVIRVNHEKLSVRYLKHYLDRLLSIKYYERWFTGGTVKFLNKKTMAGIEIPLPPIKEQKRIATILDKADAIRRKRQQAIDLTDQLLRSVFLDMFGDPVTNPKGLKTAKISEIGEVITGSSPSRAKPEYYGEHIEWIKSGNINTPNHYLTEAEEFLSKEGLLVGRSVPENSLLVTCIAGSKDCIGNVAIANRTVSFNQQINAIVPNDNILTLFLYAQLAFNKVLVQRASTESMKGMVSKSKFSEIKILLPSIPDQEKYVLFFNKTLNEIKIMKSSSENSVNLFNSLTQQAFNGQLSKQTKAAKIKESVTNKNH